MWMDADRQSEIVGRVSCEVLLFAKRLDQTKGVITIFGFERPYVGVISLQAEPSLSTKSM